MNKYYRIVHWQCYPEPREQDEDHFYDLVEMTCDEYGDYESFKVIVSYNWIGQLVDNAEALGIVKMLREALSKPILERKDLEKYGVTEER